MAEFDVSQYPPDYIGPTWRRSEDGKFVVPDKTLGWEIAAWCAKYLLNPNGDGPWMFTAEQLRFILWWYALDEGGRFIYRDGVLQRLKGWGKDPLAAVMCLIELCGPSRFSHWAEDGTPRGKPHPTPWIEVYGVSQTSTQTTSTMFPLLISERLKDDYNVKPGVEIIYANSGRGRLVMRSGGYRSAEGGRVTFMVLGEIQHWTASNGGHSLFLTVRNNATKTRSRWVAITNAYLPGEDSVAEQLREAHEKVMDGSARAVGRLYDSIEAHEDTPLTEEALRAVIPLIRGDATWLDVDDIIDSVMDVAQPPSRSRRMWLNQIVSSDEALVTRSELQEIELNDGISEGEAIVLGFDGSEVNDATALVAIRVSDGLAQAIHIQEKPDDDPNWSVDRDLVDEAVRGCFDVYDVQAFFCDVRLWESYISQWSKDFGDRVLVPSAGRNAFAWDMRGGARKRVTFANEFLVRLIRDGVISLSTQGKHYRTMRRHILNARRRENIYGVSFGKESKNSPKKIDAYSALVVAAAAWDAVRQSGKKRKETGRMWAF